MAFWKKSEDPWDQLPKKPAAEPPAMICPWCGQEMARGYLDAVKGGGLWWLTEKPGLKAGLIGSDPKTSLRVDDEGAFFTYKTAWHCQVCEKMVMDTTNIRRPYDSGGLSSTLETPEETKQE